MKQLCEVTGKACGLLACSVPPVARVELVGQLKRSLDEKLTIIRSAVDEAIEQRNEATKEHAKLIAQLEELKANTDLFALLRDFAEMSSTKPLEEKIALFDQNLKELNKKLFGSDDFNISVIRKALHDAGVASSNLKVELNIATALYSQSQFIQISPTMKPAAVEHEVGFSDAVSSKVLAGFASSQQEFAIKAIGKEGQVISTASFFTSEGVRYVMFGTVNPRESKKTAIINAITKNPVVLNRYSISTIEWNLLAGDSDNAKLELVLNFLYERSAK